MQYLDAISKRMIAVCFQGKLFSITVIQVYAPTNNAEEAEVEQFYVDLQDFLELTQHRIVDTSFQTLCYKHKFNGSYFPLHGVLKARILKCFAIPFSSEPHSVRYLHHDCPSWVPPRACLSFIELDKAVVLV